MSHAFIHADERIAVVATNARIAESEAGQMTTGEGAVPKALVLPHLHAVMTFRGAIGLGYAAYTQLMLCRASDVLEAHRTVWPTLPQTIEEARGMFPLRAELRDVEIALVGWSPKAESMAMFLWSSAVEMPDGPLELGTIGMPGDVPGLNLDNIENGDPSVEGALEALSRQAEAMRAIDTPDHSVGGDAQIAEITPEGVRVVMRRDAL